MATRKKFNQKILDRMDKLQEMMESNTHLEKPSEVHDMIESISKFWPMVAEEDKDYIWSCRHAIEYQSPWEVKE